MELCCKASAASAALDSQGRRDLDVACEAAKATLNVAFLDLVQKNQGIPLMTSRSCDGTPINVVQRASSKLPSGKVVAWSGRASAEYLVKVQWARCLHADGSHQTAVAFSEAQALTWGKKVHCIIPACTKHWRTFRSLGHKGLAIEHYVWDR
eukprot:3806691-Lingulodinium_polyedra.AAC.1